MSIPCCRDECQISTSHILKLEKSKPNPPKCLSPCLTGTKELYLQLVVQSYVQIQFSLKRKKMEKTKVPGENVIPFPKEKMGTELFRKSIKDQIRNLMCLPSKERLKAISESPEPETLVQHLPEQDFYLTVKEVNDKDSLVLIRHASPSQLNFLFDMEWWEKDAPIEERAWEWLEFLRANTPRQLMMWLKNTDIELLTSLLKKWLVVEKVPDPDTVDFIEATDKLPPYTIDNIYYWNARKADKLPLLKTILATLFELDQKFYFQVMEGIIWGIQAELEEDSYRWRKGRLEDHAIPDFYDALNIYKEITPGELREKHTVNKKDPGLQVTKKTTIYPLLLLPGTNILAKAVELITDDDLLDFLKVEFAALANKVVVADRLNPGDAESLKKAVQKVIGYVQLGLDEAGGKAIHEAVKVIETYPLESIFRLGFTLVKKLKKRAGEMITHGWLSEWPHKTLILPSPYRSIIEALLLPDPQYLEILPDGSIKTGAFTGLDQLIWTSKKLSEIEWLGDIYHGVSPDYATIVRKLWPQGQPGEPTEIRIDDIILTALANQILGKTASATPVPRSALPEVIKKFQAAAEDEREDIINLFAEKINFLSEESRRSNIEYAKIVLDEFIETISEIKEPHKVDPRFIEGILIEK